MQFPRALTSYLPVTASLFQSRTDWSWCRQATVGGASGGTRGRRRSRHRQEMEDNWLREERTKPKRESENVEKWKTAKTIQSAMTFTLCCNPLHHLPFAATLCTAHRPKAVQDPGLWATKEKKGCFFSFFLFYELAVRAYRTPHIPLNEHSRPGISSDASEM